MTSIWSAIYKTSFLKKNNIKFLETQGASYQDVSFNFKAFALAKSVMLVNKPLVYYRKDNINSSINSTNKVYSVVDEFKEIESFLSNNIDLKKSLTGVKNICKFHSYLWNLYRIDKIFVPDFINFISEDLKKNYHNGEIKDDFFDRFNKKYFLLLINSPESYYRYYKRRKFIKSISKLFKV